MDKKTFEVTATIKVELTQEDIDDIVAGALEGGITYWCCKAEVVGEYLGEYASDQIARGGSLILYDNESDDKWELTLEKMLTGIGLWLESGGCSALEDGKLDLCEVDGEADDCIVQYALFGDVIFG